jgi:amidophosphoribosyltransferase
MRLHNKPREECGVFGVSLRTAEDAAGVAYSGLLTLQHRGQQGAGIAVVSGGKIICRKDVGLVTEVLSGEGHKKLPDARVAVGHVMYTKTGRVVKENMGPAVTEYFTGRIAVALNGTILNADEVRGLSVYGVVHQSESDDEAISSLITHYILKDNRRDIVKGVVKAAGYLKGAYSLAIATGAGQLIAVRDPNGFRPLCIGRNESGTAIASESCALEVCGFGEIRDVLPGEVIVVEDGVVVDQGVKLTGKHEGCGFCIVEYVYFSRPDSVIDGLSVDKARFRMGKVLAEEYPVEADIVCGVPDSGLIAASGFSYQSGLPLVSGFMMNRYVGRSFIYPTQTQRESAVRIKMNPLASNVRGKRVVLIDDSIVRGTTTTHIISCLKNAGAEEVHVRISSPPVRNACDYGINMASGENLINQMDIEGIRAKIGADSLGYISIEGLKRACESCTLPFCTACFV